MCFVEDLAACHGKWPLEGFVIGSCYRELSYIGSLSIGLQVDSSEYHYHNKETCQLRNA